MNFTSCMWEQLSLSIEEPPCEEALKLQVVEKTWKIWKKRKTVDKDWLTGEESGKRLSTKDLGS